MPKKFFIVSQAPVAEIEIKSAPDAENIQTSLKVGFRRYPMSEALKLLDGFDKKTNEEQEQILKENILYIKDAKIATYDEETLQVDEVIGVKDSREVQPFEPFWGTPAECLSVLVEHYLDSTPWKGSFFSGLMKALINKEMSDEQLLAKNS